MTPPPNLQLDGAFGQNTDAAVRRFQRSRGLTADGIVGPEVAAALGLTYMVRPVTPVPVPLPTPRGGGLQQPVREASAGGTRSNAEALVDAVVNGLTAIAVSLENSAAGIISRVVDFSARIYSAVDRATAGLRTAVRNAIRLGGAVAQAVANAMRTCLNEFLRELRQVVAFLSRLVGLDLIIQRIRAVISIVQTCINTIVDLVMQCLARATMTVVEAAARIVRTLSAAANA